MIGIKDFIRAGHADDVSACLVPEPEENKLCISMKGAIRAIVRVHGKHGPRRDASHRDQSEHPARRGSSLPSSASRAEEKKRCGRDRIPGAPLGDLHRHPVPSAREPAPSSTSCRARPWRTSTSAPRCRRTTRRCGTGCGRSSPELAVDDPDFKAEIEFIEDRPVVGIAQDEPIAAISAAAFRDDHRPRAGLERGAGRHGRHVSQRVEEASPAWSTARARVISRTRWTSTWKSTSSWSRPGSMYFQQAASWRCRLISQNHVDSRTSFS